MGIGSRSIGRSSFVTNVDRADIQRLLRIARHLDLPAWEGDEIVGVLDGSQIYGFDNVTGFYVHKSVTDLSQFWEIVNCD